MSEEYDNLIKRYEAARNSSDMWRAIHTDCYKFALPERNQFVEYSEGAEKNYSVFDSTASKSVFKFASNLQSALIPPSRKWCKLAPGNAIKKEGRDEVAKALDVITDEIFDFINASNFAMSASEGLMDLSVGTMALICQENDDDKVPFTFTAVSLEQISPEESAQGTIETCWRRYKSLKARNIKSLWPKATISSTLADKIKNSPDSFVNLVDGIIYKPNTKKKKEEEKKEGEHKEESKDYEYVVLFTDNKEIIYKESMQSSPWIIARWSKNAGETFGRGPIMQVLPDIKTLNKVVELTLTAAALTVAPPYMAFNDDIFNPDTVNLWPNEIISVSPLASNGQWPIAPVPRNGSPEYGNLLISDLRNSITDALFIDALGPIGGPTMSATEVYTRQQMLLKLIGSAFGRLQVEFLSKVIDRVIYILKKRGLIELPVIDGKEITLRYQSPLAQAQNQDDIGAFQTFIQLIREISGQNAEQAAMLALNIQELPMWLAEKLGVPLELVRSTDDIQKITKAVEERAQAQVSEQTDFSLPQGQPIQAGI